MQERCSSLGVTVDWKRVEKIVKHRNELEHYYTSLTQAALRTLVADSFILIRDFLRCQLGEAPLAELGSPTWTTLTSVASVYDKERLECEKNIKSINWTYTQVSDALHDWRCSQCGSGLIDVLNPGVDKQAAHFKCRACGKEYDYETAIEKSIEDFYSGQDFIAVKDGGEPATTICPSCSHDTYDLEENHCLICDESVERTCQRCGCPIPASELDDSGYCGWCNHMMSKDD